MVNLARATVLLFLCIVGFIFLIPVVTDECLLSKKNGETIDSRHIFFYLWSENHRNLEIKEKINQMRSKSSNEDSIKKNNEWLVHYRIKLTIYKALSRFEKLDSSINKESYLYWATYVNIMQMTDENDQVKYINRIDEVEPGDIKKMTIICDEANNLVRAIKKRSANKL